MSTTYPDVPGVEIHAPYHADYATILTDAALEFVAELHRHFDPVRHELLDSRVERQRQLNAGILPDFNPGTAHIRESDWKIAPLPADLQDRRVEITGPAERKMIINALNSGAKVFMADLEDSNAPSWANCMQGQINLRDAVRRQITYTNPDGKYYQLNDQIAVLFVRPRGWHLPEKHIVIDGEMASGALIDFGLYVFHNAQELLARGTAPYFYLPKLESRYEARLWNDVFLFAAAMLGFKPGQIKATVLIETILATFEADEILYELRDHSAGLNCGRWDYIFSYIKKLSRHAQYILPDRAQVTMTTPMMRNYALHVIKVCHRRSAPAIGGMAAQIPIRHDSLANEAALAKVKADKEREAGDGHDGTWVAHPGLVPVALEAFDRLMPTPNQITRQRPDINVSSADLLTPPVGTITEAGVRTNISVGIQYLEAWLGGLGCVPLYNLMEDAATAEISRGQLWQWVRYGAMLVDGRTMSADLFQHFLPEVMNAIRDEVGSARFEHGHYARAATLFAEMVTAPDFVEFLTLPAYDLLD